VRSVTGLGEGGGGEAERQPEGEEDFQGFHFLLGRGSVPAAAARVRQWCKRRDR
jgi:hypothetical protein